MEATSFRFSKIGAAVVAAFFLATTPALADKLEGLFDDAQSGDIVFDLIRKGSRIGHHSVRYTPLDDGRLQVDVAIGIKVKFAFITAYRYEHRNREIWSSDGQTLLSIETQTYNNGEELSVSGALKDGVFTVTDANGNTASLEGLVVPTSYWNAAILSGDAQILNTQKGVPADVTFDLQETKQAPLPAAATVSADLFLSKGELQNVFVDYAQQGQCWVGLEFLPPKQEVKISYELKAYFPQARPDLSAYAPIAPCLKLSGDSAETNARLAGSGGLS